MRDWKLRREQMEQMRGSRDLPSGSVRSTTSPRRIQHMSMCSFLVSWETTRFPLKIGRYCGLGEGIWNGHQFLSDQMHPQPRI